MPTNETTIDPYLKGISERAENESAELFEGDMYRAMSAITKFGGMFPGRLSALEWSSTTVFAGVVYGAGIRVSIYDTTAIEVQDYMATMGHECPTDTESGASGRLIRLFYSNAMGSDTLVLSVWEGE